MNNLKFEIFFGNAGGVKNQINKWLSENNIEVVKMCKTDDDDGYTISFLYKESETVKMKRKVRLIIQSDDDFKYINFTDDFEISICNFKLYGCRIDHDTIIEIDSIWNMDCFPLNQTLKRI